MRQHSQRHRRVVLYPIKKASKQDFLHLWVSLWPYWLIFATLLASSGVWTFSYIFFFFPCYILGQFWASGSLMKFIQVYRYTINQTYETDDIPGTYSEHCYYRHNRLCTVCMSHEGKNEYDNEQLSNECEWKYVWQSAAECECTSICFKSPTVQETATTVYIIGSALEVVTKFTPLCSWSVVLGIRFMRHWK